MMFALPALAADPAVKVKFTALADRLSVRDSVRVALIAMAWAPEFKAWAEAKEAMPVRNNAITAKRTRRYDTDATFMNLLPPFFDFCGPHPTKSGSTTKSNGAIIRETRESSMVPEN